MQNLQNDQLNTASFTQQIHAAIYEATYQANVNATKTVLDELNESHNIKELLEKLSYLPKDIFNQRFKVNNFRSQQRTLFKDLKEQEAQIKSMENDMLFVISTETNPDTGKSRYTNDTARKAELENRKKTDSGYLSTESLVRTIRDQLDDLENQVAMAEAELERLQHTFSAVLRETSLTTQEMAIVAATMQSRGHMATVTAPVHPTGPNPYTDPTGHADKHTDGWDE